MPKCAEELQLDKHSEYFQQGFVNLINKVCKIFVDDGVTHSEETKDHLNDLSATFKRLAANKVSLKASKCIWGTAKLPMLGHLVKAKKGISADPDKVRAILQTKQPDLSNELRSFIGQCEYQRKFIPCLHEYLAPLRSIVSDCPYKQLWIYRTDRHRRQNRHLMLSKWLWHRTQY